MTSSTEKENLRLREELRRRDQEERDRLRREVEQLKSEVMHFRQEAQRNADLGKQIAAEYEKELAALRATLEALRKEQTTNARDGIYRTV